MLIEGCALQWDAKQLLSGIRVEQQQVVRQVGGLPDFFLQAESGEHRQYVGADLDSVADRRDFGGLLQQADLAPLLAKRQRRGNTAETAADNDDGAIFLMFSHGDFPSQAASSRWKPQNFIKRSSLSATSNASSRTVCATRVARGATKTSPRAHSNRWSPTSLTPLPPSTT
jgi:hypothetical protein